MTELLTALSLAGGAFALGLWFGERGRRLDAQRREGVLKVDAPGPAASILPGSGVSQDVTQELAPPEAYVAQTMRETGCTRAEAEEDWRRMIGRVFTDEGPGKWGLDP